MHVFILDRERDTLSRVSAFPSSFDPVWSPDGAHLSFWANDSIYRMAADGSGEPERTVVNGIPNSFTPDGKHLAYLTWGVAGRDPRDCFPRSQP